MKAILFSAVLTAAHNACAQTPSLSLSNGYGAPGATVTLSVSLDGNRGAPLSSAGWDFGYSTTDLSLASGTYYATGPAASAVGKSASCKLISAGDIRCIIAGLNNTALGNGILATVNFQIASATSDISSSVTFTKLSAADSNGKHVTMNATGGTVTINRATVHPSSTSSLASMTAPGPSGPVFKVPGPLAVQAGKPLNFTLSAADHSGDAVVSASGLPKNARFDPNRGAFSWVPASSQIGIHKVHFTATNLAGITSSTDVAIKVGSDIPIVLLMENAASLSNDGGCSPGGIVTLSGGSFTNGPDERAQTSSLPTKLSEVHVTGNGVDLPLLYASEFQVNVQCPQAAPGTTLTVVVEGPKGSSAPLSSTVQPTTPGIFSLDGSGKGQGAIVSANTATLAMPHVDGIPSQPVKAGDFISIFATGLGAVTPTVASGQRAPLDTEVRLNAQVDVLINGVAAEVKFAGLVPGQIGLYRVDAMIPVKTEASDTVTVQLVVHRADGTGALSNIVTVAVAKQQVAESEVNPSGVLWCSSRGVLSRSKTWRLSEASQDEI